MDIYTLSKQKKQVITVNVSGSTTGFSNTKVVLVNPQGEAAVLQVFKTGGVKDLKLDLTPELGGSHLLICTTIDFSLFEFDFYERSWEILYQLEGGYFGLKTIVERCDEGESFNYIEKRIFIDCLKSAEKQLNNLCQSIRAEAETLCLFPALLNTTQPKQTSLSNPR